MNHAFPFRARLPNILVLFVVLLHYCLLVASNHRTFKCDVRALVEHLCSQEDCSHSGRFIRGSVGARQLSRKVVNIKWSKWNSNSGLGWIKVKKGDCCVQHNMMEYYPVRSENNFEMQFDDERPPIYNAEDYAHHLRKYSRLTGAQLYSLSRHRSENRADKKDNRTGWEWKICNIEHDYWLIDNFVGYFQSCKKRFK